MREFACSSGGHTLKAHSSVEGGSQQGAEEPHQTTSQESSNELVKEKLKEDTDADVMDMLDHMAFPVCASRKVPSVLWSLPDSKPNLKPTLKTES